MVEHPIHRPPAADRPINHEQFNPRSITVATTTMNRKWFSGAIEPNADPALMTDKVRGDLAIENLGFLANNGVNVVVVDGGSPPEFVQALQAAGITVVPEEAKTMSGGRRQALLEASKVNGTETIIWSEPEKPWPIDSVATVTEPIRAGRAEIVVPKRDKKLFKETCPSYQYESETDANNMCNRLVRSRGLLPEGKDLDWYFGPKVIKNDPHVLKFFMEEYAIDTSGKGVDKYANPEKYADVLFYSIVNALEQGLRVESVEIPFRYPEQQKANEESQGEELKKMFIEKRKQQRYGIIVEMLQRMRLADQRSLEQSLVQTTDEQERTRIQEKLASSQKKTKLRKVENQQSSG